MDPIIITVVAAIAALLIGLIAGKIIFNKNTQKLVEESEHQADRILKDAQLQAETLKEKKVLEAKEHFLQLKTEHDKTVLQRNQKINDGENRIKQKEKELNDKTQQAQKQIQEYNQSSTKNTFVSWKKYPI